MIDRCLILDTETGGLQEEDPIVEIGMILYSVKNQCSLREFSTLIPAGSNNAEGVNRISLAALAEIKTIPNDAVISMIIEIVEAADCYVSHNADFDQEVLQRWRSYFIEKPWLCTMQDFKWPRGHAQGSLAMLALDHGLGVATAHRALTDCRLISRLFDAVESPEALQERFAVAMRPKALFIGKQRFEDNQLAKDFGFKWNRLVPNEWARRMAIEDTKLLPFLVQRVKETKKEK